MPFTTFKTQVAVEGQEEPIEVEVALPDGATGYDKEEVRDLFIPKKEFERRAESIATQRVEASLDDEDFRTKALGKWGINLDDKGQAATGEQVEKAIQKNRSEWEKVELEPVRTQVNELNGKLDRFLSRMLDSAILTSAQAQGVLEEFTTPPVEGRPAPIVQMLRGYFGYDEEAEDFLVREGEGWAMSSSPTKNRMYKNVDEFVADFVKDKVTFVGDKRQKGPGAGAPGGPKGPENVEEQIAAAEAKGDFFTASQLKAQQLSTARTES